MKTGMMRSRRQDRPKKQFTTDGCSGGMSWAWRRISGKPPPWERDCVEHDHRYWRGGPKGCRLEADGELAKRVRDRGHPVWAAVIHWSVRIGGSPIWPFPWRWDYGRQWNPFNGYRQAPDPPATNFSHGE